MFHFSKAILKLCADKFTAFVVDTTLRQGVSSDPGLLVAISYVLANLPVYSYDLDKVRDSIYARQRSKLVASAINFESDPRLLLPKGLT